MPIVYKNGLKTKVTCSRCNAKVDATIYQNRIRWVAHLSCPHGRKVMGYVNDPNYLVSTGLASSDRSAREEHDQKKAEAQLELMDRIAFERKKQGVSTGKKYI